jgi:hypothetical protein
MPLPIQVLHVLVLRIIRSPFLVQESPVADINQTNF